TISSAGIGVEDILIIANQTASDPLDVWRYLHARELESETKIPAEVYYAWFTQDLPANIDNLSTIDNDTLIEALKASAAQNHVSTKTGKNADQTIVRWNTYLAQKLLQAEPGL